MAGACGNGTRCVADCLAEQTGETDVAAGDLRRRSRLPARAATGSITVDMGAPRLAWNEIPLARRIADTRAMRCRSARSTAVLHSPSCVSMGNPHAIFWVDDIDAYDLGGIGPLLENHPIFPQRANISLAQIVARDHIRLKRLGARRRVDAGLRLGRLRHRGRRGARRTGARGKSASRCRAAIFVIEWRESDGHVLMTGPVEFEFEARARSGVVRGRRRRT